MKQVDEPDDKDNDDSEFEEKYATLVELIDPEAIELFGGVRLAGDLGFYSRAIVGHADLERPPRRSRRAENMSLRNLTRQSPASAGFRPAAT
jgi:hypothetical protein